jgi:phenylacetate-CoA ligase
MKTHSVITPRIPISKAVKMVRQTTSFAWNQKMQKMTLALFHKASNRVPAYKAFLEKKQVFPKSIKTWEDFQNVPITNKNDYLRTSTLPDLCWDGTLARPATFSSTSGSTGKPFYFQRSMNLEEEYSVIVELFLTQGMNVQNSKKPTLVIIGFGMGVWIGGMLTYRAYEICSQRGYPISILPAGINKAEILNALKELSPQYAQTILVGYPPFIKDVLDEAEREGIDLKKLCLRLQFAAESFTEQFRDYLGKKGGISNVIRDTLNIYGTADIGAMAFETPTAIIIRRLALENPTIFKGLFGDIKKLPTLAQYNPAFMTFESNSEGEILLTGNSAIPLIRYAIGDHGGVWTYDEICTLLRSEGISLEDEAKKYEVPLYELPFVFVYARVDLSTKLYGATIYPEHVREALENDELQQQITGKCTIQTLTDDSHAQYLEVNIEMRPNTNHTEELKLAIQNQIVVNLLEKNSEYENNHKSMGQKVLPQIVLWPHADETYFKPGIKQQWVKR